MDEKKFDEANQARVCLAENNTRLGLLSEPVQHTSYKPPTLEFGSRIISFVLLFYCHTKLTFSESKVWTYHCRACPGVEPGTSRTQSENPAPRLTGQTC